MKLVKIKRKVKLIPSMGRFSPEFETSKKFYSKRMGSGEGWHFHPSEYEGKTPHERRELAYQDAKKHAKFYKDLVKQGVYPEGTKIKVKREKHSDSLVVNIFMPKIKALRQEFGPYTPERGEIIRKIEETAIRYGYNASDQNGNIYMHPDLYRGVNYGIDSDGTLRYLDAEILWDFFPSEKKKKSLVTTVAKVTPLKNKQMGSLESRTNIFIFSTLAGIALTAFSFRATGNVVSGVVGSTQGLFGVLLFVVGITGLFFIKKKN